MASKDSTKIVDEVARQAMWTEVIRKENAVVGESHKFFLNPNKLVFLARKPTEVDPRTYEMDHHNFSEGQRAAVGAVVQETEETQGSEANHDTLDAGSAKLWKTEAQRWGNFYGKEGDPATDRFSSQNSSWWKPLSKCDVTEYSDRYYEMTGVGPYARKKQGK